MIFGGIIQKLVYRFMIIHLLTELANHLENIMNIVHDCDGMEKAKEKGEIIEIIEVKCRLCFEEEFDSNLREFGLKLLLKEG